MPTEPPRRMCAPSTICACGSGSAVRLYGHQLYRSPDSRPAFTISQGDLSLDKHRLREPAYRVPDCVFSGPNGVREIYGSRGHPARIEPVRSLVLDSFDRHFSFPRVLQFCDVPVFVGCRRIRQLADATKAVSEWFPKQERALATAFFDSGSSIGSAIAPFVILPIYFRWRWRAVFVIPGLFGLIWLLVWRSAYHLPREHPRLSAAERKKILADATDPQSAVAHHFRWVDLMKLPQTWGTIVARAFTDPVWFFIVDWFPIYLVAKGISLKSGLIAIWIPFIAADLGNLWEAQPPVLDQSRLVIRRSPQGGSRLRWDWSDAAHPDHRNREPGGNHRAVRAGYVLLRYVHDNRECLAFRSVQGRCGGLCEWNGRDGRRHRDDHRIRIDWALFRRTLIPGHSLFRFDHHCRWAGAVRWDDSRTAARAEYTSHGGGNCPANLVGSRFFSRQCCRFRY